MLLNVAISLTLHACRTDEVDPSTTLLLNVGESVVAMAPRIIYISPLLSIIWTILSLGLYLCCRKRKKEFVAVTATRCILFCNVTHLGKPSGYIQSSFLLSSLCSGVTEYYRWEYGLVDFLLCQPCCNSLNGIPSKYGYIKMEFGNQKRNQLGLRPMVALRGRMKVDTELGFTEFCSALLAKLNATLIAKPQVKIALTLGPGQVPKSLPTAKVENLLYLTAVMSTHSFKRWFIAFLVLLSPLMLSSLLSLIYAPFVILALLLSGLMLSYICTFSLPWLAAHLECCCSRKQRLLLTDRRIGVISEVRSRCGRAKQVRYSFQVLSPGGEYILRKQRVTECCCCWRYASLEVPRAVYRFPNNGDAAEEIFGMLAVQKKGLLATFAGSTLPIFTDIVLPEDIHQMKGESIKWQSRYDLSHSCRGFLIVFLVVVFLQLHGIVLLILLWFVAPCLQIYFSRGKLILSSHKWIRHQSYLWYGLFSFSAKSSYLYYDDISHIATSGDERACACAAPRGSLVVTSEQRVSSWPYEDLAAYSALSEWLLAEKTSSAPSGSGTWHGSQTSEQTNDMEIDSELSAPSTRRRRPSVVEFYTEPADIEPAPSSFSLSRRPSLANGRRRSIASEDNDNESAIAAGASAAAAVRLNRGRHFSEGPGENFSTSTTSTSAFEGDRRTHSLSGPAGRAARVPLHVLPEPSSDFVPGIQVESPHSPHSPLAPESPLTPRRGSERLPSLPNRSTAALPPNLLQPPVSDF